MPPPVITRGDSPSELSKDRLRGTLNVYYRGCLWTLTWYRDKEVEGFLLNAYELQLLGLDLTQVMRQIAASSAAKSSRPPLDYWSGAVEKLAYRTPGGDLKWDSPGYDLPEGAVVESVQFRAHPKHLPFSDIMESLRRYGKPLGLKAHNLLFSLEGVFIENASLLYGTVKTLGLEPRAVARQIKEWRDAAHAKVASSATAGASTPAEQEPQAVGEDESIPPAVRNLVLPRPQLAKALGKSARTLKNWDDAGCVPTGVKWYPADKVSRNTALYVVGKNWRAIQSMMPEGREVDKRLAEELLRIKLSDDDK